MQAKVSKRKKQRAGLNIKTYIFSPLWLTRYVSLYLSFWQKIKFISTKGHTQHSTCSLVRPRQKVTDNMDFFVPDNDY